MLEVTNELFYLNVNIIKKFEKHLKRGEDGYVTEYI